MTKKDSTGVELLAASQKSREGTILDSAQAKPGKGLRASRCRHASKCQAQSQRDTWSGRTEGRASMKPTSSDVEIQRTSDRGSPVESPLTA